MDASSVASKIRDLLGRMVVQGSQAQGRGVPIFWIERGSVAKAARTLREDPDLQMALLDGVSAMVVEGSWAVTYFVTSTKLGSTAALRVTADGRKKSDAPKIPSVAAVWPAAELYERALAERDGLSFEGGGREA